MNKEFNDTLAYIGNILNNNKITWVVGGSVLLNHYEITDIVNDIDIIVTMSDYEKVKEILTSLEKIKELPKKGIYKTEGYLKLKVNNVDIDIMANFKIEHSNGVYEYILNKDSISQVTQINNISVPLGKIEDWYEIYKLIPGRDEKVKMLEEYLAK